MPEIKRRSNFYKHTMILILLLLPLSLFANFDFNANCLKAYQCIFELKLTTARQFIATEKKAHPNNAIVPLLENYVDYFYLLSTNSKQDFEKLERNRSSRLDQISDDDQKSPYYLYAQAEINLQWALLHSRFGSYYTAAREINKANSLLKENSEKFPGFHLNGKGLGIIQVVMGAMPDGFLKSTLSTFGIKGNVYTGLSMLDKLAENLPKSAYESFYEEVIFYYAYVLTDVVHASNAYSKTLKYTSRFADSSLLKTYLQAYVAVKSGHNDEAIAVLNDKPTGPSYQPFPYLDYLMGISRLNKLDFSAATYFNLFLENNKGVSYVKDAYLHLGWIALLKDDQAGYMQQLSKVKSIGYTYHERDKQALNEANGPIPNKQLLHSRLLYDGGYLNKALDILTQLKAESLISIKDKTEYHYRLGRVNDDLGKKDQALTNYQQVINLGKSLSHYYAAKAAILSGNIFEQKKNYAKAKSMYNLAIAIKDHEFENAIENEAKQGLKRITQ